MSRVLIAGIAVVLLTGCSDDEQRSVADRTGPSNDELAEYLARETKLDSDQADALMSTQDAAIRPRGEHEGWREQDDGMWLRERDGHVAFVTVGSYPVGFAPDLTSKALLAETKRQLRQYSDVEPVFRHEQVGPHFRRLDVARLDYASVSPAGRGIEHVQYTLHIGARVYNVVGGAQTAIWPQQRPDVESFIATFDFEHPVPAPTRVPPGMASPDDEVQPLFAGASTREVQDAIATWTHTPEGDDKPWYPSLVDCAESSSLVPDEWQCTIDFITPDGPERDVAVAIATSASGLWTASL